MSGRAGPIAVAALCAVLVATLGALATDLGPWYRQLVKPPWQPPDALFGPAWTVIFALCALSASTAWFHAPGDDARMRVLALFGVNMTLNVAWSLLFFRLHRPDWALAEVGLLWLSIVALIVFIRPISAAAAWQLVPYLAWVSFAAFLNLAIVRLNRPFG
jgi:tryptophan-rich sensory protein